MQALILILVSQTNYPLHRHFYLCDKVAFLAEWWQNGRNYIPPTHVLYHVEGN